MKATALTAAAFALFLRATLPAAQPSMEIVHMDNPPFPLSVSQRGILQGEADAIISIAPDGSIDDWLVTAHTDPAFERQAGEILRTLRCRLSGLENRPGPIRTTLRLHFETHGAVISHTVNDTVDSLITRITGTSRIEKLTTVASLDRPPVPLRTVNPSVPGALHAAAGSRITLEFIIDETGRPRMPFLHRGENIPFAKAATDALLAWQFSPPTRNGRPVIVAVRQEFIFSPR